MEVYLTAKDIAERLHIKEWSANNLMRKMPGVFDLHGSVPGSKRTVMRITEQNFEKWTEAVAMQIQEPKRKRTPNIGLDENGKIERRK